MIDTKALRSRVLDLAIRGKLTEQLPSDGTAEELYQQIQAEKQKILDTGILKGKKKIIIREISKEQEPFSLPSNWKWLRLGSVSEIFGRIGFRGYTKNDIVDEMQGALSLSPSNITVSGDIVFEKCTYITWDKYEESPEIQIKNGDIIIVKTGSSYGKSCVVNKLPCKATINPQLAVLKYVLCCADYLKLVLNSSLAKKQYNVFVIGAATPTFSQENLANLLISMPPLAEQKRIVERVEEIFKLLDTIDEAQEKYTADAQSLKAKLITAGIQGKLTEQLDRDGTAEVLYQQIQEEKKKLIKEGKLKNEKPLPPIKPEEIPFEIPESWKWVRLGSLLHGVTDGPHYSPKYIDSGIPFISTRNIANGKLDFSSAKYISPELHEELCKRCKPKKGDVLYSKGGTTGIAVVNDSDIEFNVWVHVAVLSMGANVNPYYLAMALNSPHCYGQSQEYTKGTANRDLGLTRMIKITLPLPPLAEQKRIAEVLERVLGALSLQ